ncbi:MAG TPA: RNA methyltransferase [Gaiellaceae bacterium]|nr:RNA methyltransferase [Gaiellaceae bacterium]
MRCCLTDGRCGRLGRPCRSGQCVARTVRKLQDRRWRDKLGLLVAEGEDLVAAAAAAGIPPVELLVAGENVEPELLAEVSTLGHPPRVIGVYRRDDLPRGARDTTLALWQVADPGNVGTLLRSADAFGAGVALSAGCADLTGPKALRASAGSVFRVPVSAFDEQTGRRVALVAHGGTPLRDVELAPPVVLVLGAERDGLPEDVLARCDALASIPLADGAESLNVATAGAIALYELARRL